MSEPRLTPEVVAKFKGMFGLLPNESMLMVIPAVMREREAVKDERAEGATDAP